MKIVYFLILCSLSLTQFNVIINKSRKQNVEIMDYPFTIFLEGKPIHWIKGSIPYVFIEFNSNEEIYGYIAYYRKTRGFDCYWKFKLIKHGDRYLSDSIPSCYEQTLKNTPISIVNYGKIWSVSFPEDKTQYHLSYLPKDYSNKDRNYIYALSSFQVLYSQRQFKKGWHYELTNNKDTYFKYEEEPILNGNFNIMKKHVDSLDLDELANLLHIKDY